MARRTRLCGISHLPLWHFPTQNTTTKQAASLEEHWLTTALTTTMVPLSTTEKPLNGWENGRKKESKVQHKTIWKRRGKRFSMLCSTGYSLLHNKKHQGYHKRTKKGETNFLDASVPHHHVLLDNISTRAEYTKEEKKREKANCKCREKNAASWIATCAETTF